MKRRASTSLTSKGLERELGIAVKLFQGKETELNWDKRESTLLLIHSLLRHDSFHEWESIILQGIHDLVYGIADAVQSLRTKYSFAAFDLIAEIGRILGMRLDITTFETLVKALLRCSSSSKQMVANKAKDTMIVFLSTTSYYSRIITHLSSAFADKNHQMRHFVAMYLKTYLETHTPNALIRANMEKQTTLDVIDLFLKNGLQDSAPAVREVCRSIFSVYSKYWPSRTERLYSQLDLATRKQVEKTKSEVVKAGTGITLRKRSNPSSASSSRPVRQSRRRSNDNKLSTTDLSTQNSRVSSKPVTANRQDTMCPSPFSSLSATLPHSTTSSSSSTNQHHIPASASLLHMLRSTDAMLNSKGLRTLSKRLSTCQLRRLPYRYGNTDTVLPSTVPSRVDLVPILQGYLSSEKMLQNETLCNELMSWDCITGVFMHIFSLQHFLPTMILAGQRRCRDGKQSVDTTQQQYTSTCALGLKRLKLSLEHSDANLIKSLLDILHMTTTFDGAGLKDPNAKKELSKSTLLTTMALDNDHHNNSTKKKEGQKARDDLVLGLIQWLDELVCHYMGAETDDNHSDQTLISESDQQWTKKIRATTNIATSWLADSSNLEHCLESVVHVFHSYMSASHSVVFTSLITLIGRLRLANMRVFDSILDQTDEDIARLLKVCLPRRGLLTTFPSSFDAQHACVADNDTVSTEIRSALPAYHDIAHDSTIMTAVSPKTDHHNNSNDGSYQPLPCVRVIDQRQQQLREDDDDDDDDEYRYELNQFASEAESGDVQDTSLGSIDLEILSPEPSLASTQEPDEMENVTTYHDTSTAKAEYQTTQANSYQSQRIISDNDGDRITYEHHNDTLLIEKSTGQINDDDEDAAAALVESIRQLVSMTDSNQGGVLDKLEKLCKRLALGKQGSGKFLAHEKVWQQKIVTLPHSGEESGSLIDIVTNHVINELTRLRHHESFASSQQVVGILQLLKQLLVHQGDLLKHNENYALLVTKALVYSNGEKFSQLSLRVADVQNQLLDTFGTRTCITMVVNLLTQGLDKNDDNDSESIPSTRAHPVATIFNVMSALAKRLTSDLVHEFFKEEECSKAFLRGLNHGNLSVRQSAINALVELCHVTGDQQDVVKSHLSGIKKEQLSLLNYYLKQRK